MGDAGRCRGRPKTRPDAAQRRAIVEMACQLFLEKGYGATTTDEIAAACKISKQTLYRLFPGKPGLFKEVIAATRAKWLNFPVDETLPLDAALERMFQASLDEEADRVRLGLLHLVVAEGGHFPELREAVRLCGAEVSRAELAGWLARQSARGRLKPCDPRRAANILMDMVYGAIIVKSTGEVEYPAGAERVEHIHACIQMFLHGLAVPPQGQVPVNSSSA